MEPSPILRIILALERLALSLRKVLAIAAVVILIGICAFGLYALRSLFERGVSPGRMPVPGVAPPLERGRSALEQLWSFPMPPVQDLAVIRPDSGGPQQLLVLSRSRVARYDLEGRLLRESVVPRDTYRLAADLHGRLPFFLAASTEFHWSWKELRRVATANRLTAIDLEGRTLWTYSLPAAGSSAFDVLLVDVDRGRSQDILVDVGARIVCLDPAGRERWSTPGEFRLWAQFDWQASGRPGVLFLKPSARSIDVMVLGPERQVMALASVERQSSLHAWHVAAMARSSVVTVATLAMASAPDRDGKMPDVLSVYSMSGAPIGRATLPWPTRPIGRNALATVDTDGDGARAWITAGDDGVVYLFSADAGAREAHHTGRYIRVFTVVPHADPGDRLVIGTEQGLEVWRRRPTARSPVD